jgi:hypothetical protein
MADKKKELQSMLETISIEAEDSKEFKYIIRTGKEGAKKLLNAIEFFYFKDCSLEFSKFLNADSPVLSIWRRSDEYFLNPAATLVIDPFLDSNHYHGDSTQNLETHKYFFYKTKDHGAN